MLNPGMLGSTGLAGIGGWKELGRRTLGATNAAIELTGLANKRYLMFMNHLITTGSTLNWNHRTGNGSFDAGSNYSIRRSENNGADSTLTLQSTFTAATASRAVDVFGIGFCANVAAREKLIIYNSLDQGASGAGTAPNRQELYSKWTNTSNVMDRIRVATTSNTYEVGSEIVVLGWDPSDIHTDNFWEEIGSGTGTGISDITLSASKKYNMFAGYVKASGTINTLLRVGAGSIDTGTNYARRSSVNGAADTTATAASSIDIRAGTITTAMLVWGFVVNVSTREKTFIVHTVEQNTVGAGTAPNRTEVVGKWADTSNQFNHFGIQESDSGSIAASSFLKVWGHD